MTTRLRSTIVFLLCFLMVSFISVPAVQSQELSGEVQIAGSSTVFPVATAMAEEFRKIHPDVQISVSSTGSGGGFSNFFCPGKTDINNASRPIKPEELKQCYDNGVNPIQMRIATDALTVVVNEENDWADCMTPKQLKKIWRPNNPAQTWSDINSDWPDEEIELYGAASTSGTFDYFTETIMGEEDAHRSDYSATEHDNTIVQGVSGSKHAMGYFGFAYYSQNPDQVKAVAIDNGNGCVKPSLDTASAGEYKPLARPLFIYPSQSALQNKSQVREFVKYFVKNSTQDIVAQVGYVPVNRDVMLKNLGKIANAVE